jgi:hypothetical protein
MRRHAAFATGLEYPHERARWVLNAAHEYADAVTGLTARLSRLTLDSSGMRGLRAYLVAYSANPGFLRLVSDAGSVLGNLDGVRYSLLLRNGSVTVLPQGDEPDYSAVIGATFAKFRRGAVKDYRVKFAEPGRLSWVDEQILERVARLNPDVFDDLTKFVATHGQHVDETIARFDREVQFYLAYLRFIYPLRRDGLAFSYPVLTTTPCDLSAVDAADLALGAKLLKERAPIVLNSFQLHDRERMMVVTGPNHGGKTTFARMFGQLHYMAALGCSVPARQARLLLSDRLFTHFERQESAVSLRGKLQDDLIRMRGVLDHATPRSVVIINEAFSSTTVDDARFLSREVLARLSRLDLVAVIVTFIDELSTFNAKTVSYVGGIDPLDPTVRTFKVERRPADGLAYAIAVAKKYRVTYDWLIRRLSGRQA